MHAKLLILGIGLFLIGNSFAFVDLTQSTTMKWDGSPTAKHFSVSQPKTTMSWVGSPEQFMFSKTESREDNGFCCGGLNG